MSRRRFLCQSGSLLGLGAVAGGSARAAEPLDVPQAEAYALAATGHGFAVGSLMAARTAYVFFDTTCPHCAHLWLSAKPLHSKLKMVWMPVGLLRPQSLKQGATILAATDPAAAMNDNESRVLAHQNGVALAPNLSTEVLDKVRANTALFRKLGADSVPLMLFRHARTGEPGSHAGSAETSDLALMLGV